MSKDITKRLAAFERKVLKRMTGRIKVNEDGRMRCNKEVMQLFGDLDTLPSMRIISRISVNRMERKRKVSQLSNKQSSGKSTKRTTNRRRWNCVQTDIVMNAHLGTGKGG